MTAVEGADLSKDPRTIKALAALNIAGTLNMANQHDQNIAQVAASRPGESANQVEAAFKVPVTIPMSKELEAQYGLYQLPNGQWTTNLTDVARAPTTGVQPASLAPSLDDIARKYLKR